MTLLKVIVPSRFLGNDEIFKDYLTSFTVFLEILKKKKVMKKKKSSENDQSTGHFQSFFYLFFFSSPDPRSEKNFP